MKKQLFLLALLFISLVSIAQPGGGGDPGGGEPDGNGCYFKYWDLTGASGTQTSGSLTYTAATVGGNQPSAPCTILLRIKQTAGGASRIGFNGGNTVPCQVGVIRDYTLGTSCGANPTVNYNFVFENYNRVGTPSAGTTYDVYLYSVSAGHVITNISSYTINY